MNEELKNKLNEFLGKLIEGMEKAGEFAVDQIPDVVQQALTWFAWKSGVGFLAGLFLLSATPFIVKFLKKHWWQKDKSGSVLTWYDGTPKANDAVSIFGGTALVAVIVTGFYLLANNLEWLQILVAPKWFIVSEMSKLI